MKRCQSWFENFICTNICWELDYVTYFNSSLIKKDTKESEEVF